MAYITCRIPFPPLPFCPFLCQVTHTVCPFYQGLEIKLDMSGVEGSIARIPHCWRLQTWVHKSFGFARINICKDDTVSDVVDKVVAVAPKRLSNMRPEFLTFWMAGNISSVSNLTRTHIRYHVFLSGRKCRSGDRATDAFECDCRGSSLVFTPPQSACAAIRGCTSV